MSRKNAVNLHAEIDEMSEDELIERLVVIKDWNYNRLKPENIERWERSSELLIKFWQIDNYLEILSQENRPDGVNPEDYKQEQREKFITEVRKFLHDCARTWQGKTEEVLGVSS